MPMATNGEISAAQARKLAEKAMAADLKQAENKSLRMQLMNERNRSAEIESQLSWFKNNFQNGSFVGMQQMQMQPQQPQTQQYAQPQYPPQQYPMNTYQSGANEVLMQWCKMMMEHFHQQMMPNQNQVGMNQMVNPMQQLQQQQYLQYMFQQMQHQMHQMQNVPQEHNDKLIDMLNSFTRENQSQMQMFMQQQAQQIENLKRDHQYELDKVKNEGKLKEELEKLKHEQDQDARLRDAITELKAGNLQQTVAENRTKITVDEALGRIPQQQQQTQQAPAPQIIQQPAPYQPVPMPMQPVQQQPVIIQQPAGQAPQIIQQPIPQYSPSEDFAQKYMQEQINEVKTRTMIDEALLLRPQQNQPQQSAPAYVPYPYPQQPMSQGAPTFIPQAGAPAPINIDVKNENPAGAMPAPVIQQAAPAHDGRLDNALENLNATLNVMKSTPAQAPAPIIVSAPAPVAAPAPAPVVITAPAAAPAPAPVVAAAPAPAAPAAAAPAPAAGGEDPLDAMLKQMSEKLAGLSGGGDDGDDKKKKKK